MLTGYKIIYFALTIHFLILTTS